MRHEGPALRFLPRLRRPRAVSLAMIVVALAMLATSCSVFSALGPPPKPGPALQLSANPAWYGQNGPIIKAYLASLPKSLVGSELPGIRLSDGNLWLEGFTYLGPGRDLPPGLSARFVEDDAVVYAYLWMEEGAQPLSLESCADGSQKGIRARQAGGGVFAWKQLSAKEGVVYTECPPLNWLPEGVTLKPPAQAS